MDELVSKAMQKNAAAFTTLMQSNMQRMYKTARAILMSDADVADAIQETILSCWEHIDSLKSPQYFQTWMIRILVNKCYDQIRRNQNLTSIPEEMEIPYREDRFQNLEWKQTLRNIDEKYRLIIMLYYVDGLKTAEIAQILGIPDATVRTRLARARKMLSTIYFDSEKTEKGVVL